jgi:hypothetical protein
VVYTELSNAGVKGALGLSVMRDLGGQAYDCFVTGIDLPPTDLICSTIWKKLIGGGDYSLVTQVVRAAVKAHIERDLDEGAGQL